MKSLSHYLDIKRFFAGGIAVRYNLANTGKVYDGPRRGDFWVLAAGRQRKVLSTIRLDAPVFSTAVAANGALYVSTMDTLYALKQSQAAP